jgi:telomere length regulation protein
MTLTDELTVNTQILLLAAGYVHRRSPETIKHLAQSSVYLNAISNRLSAASERGRILGMLVATGMSDLADKSGKKLSFDVPEMATEESRWLLGLTKIEDNVGSLADLTDTSRTLSGTTTALAHPATKPTERRGGPETGRIISIEDVSSQVSEDGGSESEDDELPIYCKPDSDPDDSDEDATLVQRNRPTAPVYIRDLIAYLHNTESYDHQRLGLSSAAQLIRRKAHFGTEVSDHLAELASLVVGLADKFDMDGFDRMRLESMVAILMARPVEMARWYSKTFFDGDYSLAQRASVLSTLSLAARELAGLGTSSDNHELIGKASAADAHAATTPPSAGFPSQELPLRLHQLYSGVTPHEPARSRKRLSHPPILHQLAGSLQQCMITPLAASAADQLSGPNALKVRTFSSRMQVERKRSPPKANELSKIVAPAFIFPLTGRWWAGGPVSRTAGPSSFHQELLPAYLHTLAIILHAASPSTPSLPDLTHELFPIILAVLSPLGANASLSAAPEAEPLLLLLLTVIDVNEQSPDQGRGMRQAHPRELDEARAWTEAIFEACPAGEEKVRMLAASILVKLQQLAGPAWGA